MNAGRSHIVFAGGGTGGHLFPGLAVADELRRQVPDVRITFVGTGADFECQNAIAAGYDYASLPAARLPKSAWTALRFLKENMAGYQAAGSFLRRADVGLVVGLGGYASVPTSRAAIARHVPLVLLEQNAVAGRATSWLAPGAALICVALPDARVRLRSGGPVRVTGNPIRGGFVDGVLADAATSAVRASAQKRLVVLGGTHGAHELNTDVPRALYKVGVAAQGWHVLHQTGHGELATTTVLYRKLAVPATVVPFIDDMPGALASCDLAITRSGGTTLAELAAAGVPAVLLPYPHASDDHQRKNADVYTAAGAAVTVDARELADRLDNHLADVLGGLIADARARAKMSMAMADLARPDAAWQVATMLRELLRQGRQLRAG